MNPPAMVRLAPLTGASYQARQDGYPVFVIRETTQGWKTEGHPAHDGLLCATKDELMAHLEGRLP